MSNNLFKSALTSPVIRYFGRRKEKKHFSEAPIFIGGCARSGTSLLLSILSAHPEIYCFPDETDAFTDWSNSKPVRIDRMYRKLLLNDVPQEATRWCEKRPYNVRYIPEILHYFGADATFIHIVRDPRAVCTSVHPSDPGRYWVSPERWTQDVKAGLDFVNHRQVKTIRYEKLVLDTENEIRGLCEFMRVECRPEILDWTQHAKVRSHDSWFGGISQMNPKSLEKWKNKNHKLRVEGIMKYPGVSTLLKQIEQI